MDQLLVSPVVSQGILPPVRRCGLILLSIDILSLLRGDSPLKPSSKQGVDISGRRLNQEGSQIQLLPFRPALLRNLPMLRLARL